jgi:hypothetical protein
MSCTSFDLDEEHQQPFTSVEGSARRSGPENRVLRSPVAYEIVPGELMLDDTLASRATVT